jgi:transglutaminase-like putative cysteine protease
MTETMTRPEGRAARRRAAAQSPAPPPRTPLSAERILLGLTFAHVEAFAVLLVTVLAALPLRSFYGTIGWLPAVAGAVALGGVLGMLSAARRWSSLPTGGLAILLAAVYALYVCYPKLTTYGLPGPDAVRALGTGARSGWARMLTVALPGDVTGDLLITPVLAAFLAGLAGALLVSRTRLVTTLALPPLLLFLAGLLVTASRPESWTVLVVAILPALLLVLLLRASRASADDTGGIAAEDADAVGLDLAARRWHSTIGRVAFGLPVVAIAAAVGLIGAQTLPIADGAHRKDPRSLRQQEFRLAAGLTPLVEVKPQLEKPPSQLFTVKVSESGGSYPVDRVRVATLDSFDGALWTESRDFLIAGSTLPAGPALPSPKVRVTLDVNVTRLPQQFLPVVGRPIRTSGTDLAFDPENGTLVSTHGTVTDYRYRVVGEVRPQTGVLQAAAPTDMPQYTQLPNPPKWVSDLANDVTRDWPTPYTQLHAIESYLHGQGYALSARPGHSYGAIYRVLEGPPEERVGYAEQFASAFAILARAKGYAARVAVGYRLQRQKLTGDTYRVDNTDAHAWPEVYLTGYGWVPFEPTNTGNPATSTLPRDTSVPALPDNAPKDQPVQPQQDAPAAGQEGNAGGTSVSHLALLIGLIVLAVPILLLLAIVLAKVQRRARRRHRGTPADQITAAWREVLDRLRERGWPVAASTTPVEVGRDVRTGALATVAPGLAELALIATAAVCGPMEPGPPAADRSWELEADIRRNLDATTPIPVRLRALIDPRPLLPRRSRARPLKLAEPTAPPPALVSSAAAPAD